MSTSRWSFLIFIITLIRRNCFIFNARVHGEARMIPLRNMVKQNAKEISASKGPKRIADIATNSTDMVQSSSLESSFGLGSNQLRELNEQYIPVPRDVLPQDTSTTLSENEESSKVFKLPDLNEFVKQDFVRTQRPNVDSKNAEQSKRRSLRGINLKNKPPMSGIKTTPESRIGTTKKVNRRDQEAYRRLMELTPYADADESLFEEEVAAIFSYVRDKIPLISLLHFSMLVRHYSVHRRNWHAIESSHCLRAIWTSGTADCDHPCSADIQPPQSFDELSLRNSRISAPRTASNVCH